MKKIVLFALIISSYQLTAQSSWTTSNNLRSTFYGSSDSINLFFSFGNFSGYDLDYNKFSDYSSSLLKQPMRTNLLVINDSLYIIDSSKLVNSPDLFYSKSISTDSLQVVLDTNQGNLYPTGPFYLNPNRYDDEHNNLWSYSGPDILRDHEAKLNLGHYTMFQNKIIRYKSICYRIHSISNTSVNYSPKWRSSSLLPDSAVLIPSNNQFLITVENNKVIFYHASKVPDWCYNLNLSQISGDSICIDLHPSRLIHSAIPLAKNQNKTLAIDFSNSPRFEVADYNDFTDSLKIGYYYEHIFNDLTPMQGFEWITIYKQANNTITYSPTNLQILNISTPVPIRELKLSAKQARKENIINWISFGEENVDIFVIEKSNNGINFKKHSPRKCYRESRQNELFLYRQNTFQHYLL